MRQIADFHLHSKYSRATSSQMDFENLYQWAKIKGIQILGTGDFLHPLWQKEIETKLEDLGNGLFKLKDKKDDVLFCLTGEVNCVFEKWQKTRKVHLLIFLSSLKDLKRITPILSWSGNLSSDGRPTLNLDAKELLKIVKENTKDGFIVPAHAWTPWFGIFGSKSGFDSLEECFEELSGEIFSIETGLSSDPKMNWRLSKLDRLSLISNSDAHSPKKIGREANVFEIEKEKLSFSEIKRILKEKDRQKFLFTIEFYPEEGKYHFDGHRMCNVCLSPEERKKLGGICPNCGKPVTIGVMSRIDELADREEGFVPENAIPQKNLIPLEEIIAEAFETEVSTKKVEEEYFKLINHFGSEFEILMDVPIDEIKKISPKVGEGIEKMRKEEVVRIPGYDGKFGKILVFGKAEERKTQKTLF